MTINLIPNQWETLHLKIEDSVLADVPDLNHIFAACKYMEE
jgi:hypothetical protein